MAARVLAVLAALFLVGAVAVATLLPQGMTLGQAVAMLDHDSLTWLRDHSMAWLWNWVEVPFMVRPIWLMPAFVGLICAGVATTLNFGDASARRRRS